MSSLSKPSEKVGLLGVIDPDAYAAGTYVSTYAPIGLYHNALGVLHVGDMVATSTVTARMLQATDAAGTGAKVITGKLATTLTAAGTDSNKQVLFNVSEHDLDHENGFAFVAIEVVVAMAASDMSAEVYGLDPKLGVVTQPATVDETL